METLESFIERTETCETEADLFRAFDTFMVSFGLNCGAYFIMAKKLRAIPPEAGLVRHNFPKSFAKAYIKNGFAKFDPIILQSIKESRPFHWRDVAKKHSLNAQQKRVFEAHKSANLLGGIAVPVFGALGTIALFSLASEGQKPKLSSTQLAIIQYACLQTHNRYFDISQIDEASPEKPLSLRETEALTLVADGLPNNVIAERLGVTENTVDTMLRRIYGKFGVNNRISAVLKGIGCGLLLP